LRFLLQVQSGRLRVADACELIGLHRRQVFRLLRGLKQDGATSLLSKRRGRPSNNRLPCEVRTLALSIVRERYADFGPTLAAEKLGSASRLAPARSAETLCPCRVGKQVRSDLIYRRVLAITRWIFGSESIFLPAFPVLQGRADRAGDGGASFLLRLVARAGSEQHWDASGCRSRRAKGGRCVH